MKRLLVTGASGLIGSEVCMHFAGIGWEIHGVDNNQRAIFFGQSGDTRWNQSRLEKSINKYTHHEVDIRDRKTILELVKHIRPDAIVHTAAQPSHDKAASIPFDDFDTNAVGTFNMIEALRQYSISVPFVHLSTNKVYGDAPNEIKMKELPTRWDYDDSFYENGIPETFRIDQTTHSLCKSMDVILVCQQRV
jgi:CDP-paratose 2-epimerase